MEWFKRKPKPPPTERKEIPDGLWTKCNSCGEIIYVRELEKALWVCRNCHYHFRIRSTDYMDILLDRVIPIASRPRDKRPDATTPSSAELAQSISVRSHSL